MTVSTPPIVKGSTVTIRKGSTVRSCNPSKEEYQLSRNQTVKVHKVVEGYPEHSGYPARNDEIHWAGSGGYWHWTDVENIISDSKSELSN